MRVGASLRTGYAGADWRTAARWAVERARAAHDAGLDHLFVGDHHALPMPYLQNTAILGRLLAEWTGRPAGALYLLPLWNPVLVAEQVCTLAAIHDSRFVVQCAIGDRDEQFAAMGADIGRRPSLFEHHLQVVRRLCAGEEVRLGPDGMELHVGPGTPEPLEVWIGGHAPAALDRAARLGDVWLAGPDATFADCRRLLDQYRERCAHHGVEPAAVAVRRDVHVGVDDADARRVAGPVMEAGYRGFHGDQCVVGGPDTVAARLAELGEMGFTDVVIRHLAEDQAEVLASFERLAEVRRLVD